MVDTDVVKRILNSLNEALEHLKEKKDISLDDYKVNRDIQAIVERRLEIAIQSCIDIGNHIVSQEGLGYPDDYAGIFNILAEKKIIDPELNNKLKKMSGFRNVLIHEYRDIIVEKVYDILQNRLSDFHEFSQVILNYIK